MLTNLVRVFNSSCPVLAEQVLASPECMDCMRVVIFEIKLIAHHFQHWHIKTDSWQAANWLAKCSIESFAATRCLEHVCLFASAWLLATNTLIQASVVMYTFNKPKAEDEFLYKIIARRISGWFEAKSPEAESAGSKNFQTKIVKTLRKPKRALSKNTHQKMFGTNPSWRMG